MANMKLRMLWLILITFLAACGTFEVGIETNTILDPQFEVTEVPTSEIVDPTVPVPTQTPIPTDEQLIALALADELDQPADQLAINMESITDLHATGGVGNGYFLAARQGDSWLIVYDGQAIPSCTVVETYQFPIEMVPECLDPDANLFTRAEIVHDPVSNLQSLDCGPGSPGAIPGSVESVACIIQDALRSRNISALPDYMEDPFIIGYWLSEGVFYAPQDFINHLPHLYNFNDPDYTPRLTFTTDRSQFPELDGRPVEGNFGPDVKVVEVMYSQGWGVEGDQEVMIYLTQDSAGNFKWHSMLIGVFDPPIPSP